VDNITFHHRKDGGYLAVYKNGVSLGDLDCDLDGYYNFFPENRSGYWPAHVLRELADKLDALNKEWDQKVRAYHSGEEENVVCT
jgi:hypothetical protein